MTQCKASMIACTFGLILPAEFPAEEVIFNRLWQSASCRQNKAAFTRQTWVGKLELANSCWQTQVGVCELHKNSRQTSWQTVGDKWNFDLFSPTFRQLFRVGKLASDVWTDGQHVLVIVNQSKRALFSWFICITLHKMGDASQHF